MPDRRFPPPWSVEELEARFVVRDQTGKPLAYIHYEGKAGPPSAGKLLTRDEARLIAAKIAKLPELLTHPSGRAVDGHLTRPSRSFTILNSLHVVEFIVLLVLGMLGGVAIVFIALFGR